LEFTNYRFLNVFLQINLNVLTAVMEGKELCYVQLVEHIKSAEFAKDTCQGTVLLRSQIDVTHASGKQLPPVHHAGMW
jgi:hypothetical protein